MLYVKNLLEKCFIICNTKFDPVLCLHYFVCFSLVVAVAAWMPLLLREGHANGN